MEKTYVVVMHDSYYRKYYVRFEGTKDECVQELDRLENMFNVEGSSGVYRHSSMSLENGFYGQEYFVAPESKREKYE